MIQGKIIRFLDLERFVINLGTDLGVYESMEIEVFLEGSELIDPDTNESLGTLDYIKGKYEVEYSAKLYSICSKPVEEEKTIETNPFLRNLTSFSSNPKTIVHSYLEKLNIDESDIEGYGFDTTNKLKIGDLIRIVED